MHIIRMEVFAFIEGKHLIKYVSNGLSRDVILYDYGYDFFHSFIMHLVTIFSGKSSRMIIRDALEVRLRMLIPYIDLWPQVRVLSIDYCTCYMYKPKYDHKRVESDYLI